MQFTVMLQLRESLPLQVRQHVQCTQYLNFLVINNVVSYEPLQALLRSTPSS